MRGRAVHHVYAEDEQPAESYEEQSTVSYDEQPHASYAEGPTESHEHPLAQPPWRVGRQGRVVAMALLGAAIAFVAVFAIHALTRPATVVGPGAAGGIGSQSAPVQMRHRAIGAPLRGSMSRHTQAVALRDEKHAVAHFSTAAVAVTTTTTTATITAAATTTVAPVAPARAAGSEFTFER